VYLEKSTLRKPGLAKENILVSGLGLNVLVYIISAILGGLLEAVRVTESDILSTLDVLV
jgi:hypothetical protein